MFLGGVEATEPGKGEISETRTCDCSGNNRTRFGLFSPPMPTTSLPALEQHLEACLLELEKLHRTRPGLPTALERANAGQKIDELLGEIAELQRMIEMSPAETLEDAAVKLRLRPRLQS